MDQDRSPQVGDRWDTGRIEAFSDGVFAIAITLLILEVSVPESDFDNLWRGIAHQWPAYLGYATSFITIGWIWMVHHSIFRRLRLANSWVMRINLALLMAVSFLPFPTKLLAEAIHERAERAAVIFYGATVFVISLLLGALSRVITPDLLEPGVSKQDMNAIFVAATPSLGFYIAVIVLAIFAAGGRVRLPRDRDRRHTTRAWRQAHATCTTTVRSRSASVVVVDRRLAGQTMPGADELAGFRLRPVRPDPGDRCATRGDHGTNGRCAWFQDCLQQQRHGSQSETTRDTARTAIRWPARRPASPHQNPREAVPTRMIAWIVRV
jgi:uncharacterized membrane protein